MVHFTCNGREGQYGRAAADPGTALAVVHLPCESAVQGHVLLCKEGHVV
jgi:hypothetical protein